MNNIMLIGRLTKDPELKYSQSGKAFCRFTLAVTREYNRDEADFINCVAWEKRAEIITEYLNKGKRLSVQGRIQTGSYKNDSGNTVYTTDVVVEKIFFIDTSGNENKEVSENEDIDDDFPF